MEYTRTHNQNIPGQNQTRNISGQTKNRIYQDIEPEYPRTKQNMEYTRTLNQNTPGQNKAWNI